MARTQQIGGAVGGFELQTLIANVVGEFEVIEAHKRPGNNSLVDWELSPVRVVLNELELRSFVFESFGGSRGEVDSEGGPGFAAGDRIFIQAQAKTDGRLVQNRSYVLVRDGDGGTRTGDGAKVFQIDRSGLHVSSGGHDWVGPGEVESASLDGTSLRWTGAMGYADLVVAAAASNRAFTQGEGSVQ